MLAEPIRLSIFVGLIALAAVGLTLALAGLGLPFLPAALIAAGAAGVVRYAAATAATPEIAIPSPDAALLQQLDEYRQHTATLRHDLRGVLSPALMMTDRLLNHTDPAVQRAGNAIVRSIDRATTLLSESKDVMTLPP